MAGNGVERQVWDQATGLPGMILFRDRLKRAMARADRAHVMVALLCLDFGDAEPTKEIASRLNRCLRAADSVTLGTGGNFSIIQTDLTHFDNAALLAQKLLDAVGPTVAGNVGIALYPDDAKDPDEMLEIASTAAGSAREKGLPYAYRTAALTATSRTHVDLVRDLRHAIDAGDQLAMVYQPKMDLRSGNIVGAEALLRWYHPIRGLLWPEEFLHIAEESDLILPVGDWALRQACKDAVKWGARGGDKMRVAVNIAAPQLARPEFPDLLRQILAELDFPPSRLEIELSERTVMHEPREYIGVLDQLAEMGVEISIDDFGTGFSSLSFLKLFPIVRIKIDRSFVTGLPTDPFDAAIVRGVIGLGHGLRLEVVAEGVDKLAQLDYLRAEGCDQVQGHYFSPPLPADECGRLIGEGQGNI